MAHRVSAKGIVGLGALGLALDQLTSDQDGLGVVFFTVKAFDLRSALLEQADKWPIDRPFITLCNGYIWPIVSELQTHLGGRTLRIGMTTIGSTIQPSGNVRIFTTGTTTAWGHWPSPSYPLTPPSAQELKCLKSFPNGTWQNDIRPMIRRKWVLNVAINSVTAAHRLEQNGLLRNYKNELENVLVEAIDLASKLWNDLPWEIGESENILKQLWQVVDATAGNQNSMARDMILGRQTESDFLAGMAQHFAGFPKLKKLHEAIVKRTDYA